MSHDDSLDEETRKLLEEIDISNDSKESDKSKKVDNKQQHKNDVFNEYDIDDRDPIDHKEMDDMEW